MSDSQVLAAQRWLNATYHGTSGWVAVAEDGITGWSTMYAIRRALQAELGVTPLSAGFGPATTAAFVAQVGAIDVGTASTNLYWILSSCLWCKGYAGFYDDSRVVFNTLIDSLADVQEDLGLSPVEYVDVKLMLSLTTMDAYTKVSGGTNEIRKVQQWMNSSYLRSRADFAVVPCDGIYSRQVQTALLYALQYEIGIADGVANGNFGPATRAGLSAKAGVAYGSVDGTHSFVHLYQATLLFNGYDAPFSGTFDLSTTTHTMNFQSFMELPSTGNGDYGTWCSLLVSSGDTSIATKGFDTATQLTAVEAKGAVTAGYTTVGRYTVGGTKFMTAPELDGLRAAGLKLFPIHQRFNNTAAVMTEANGRLHGIEAIERCRTLGLPNGSLVYFSVDFDADGETIAGPVADYFRGVKASMETASSTTYKVGIYGTRNACAQVLHMGYAEKAFVAGMSTGFSGNMGFPMPADWEFNQILEITVTFPGASRAFKIDKDVMSSSAKTVDLSSVVSPPIERDGSVSDTGFDAFFAWLVRAEVACERGLAAGSSILHQLRLFDSVTPAFISHWLQKPNYWDDTWKAYTPLLDTGEMVYARAAAEDELAKLSPSKPVSNRDIAHFAASLRGYEFWGVPTAPDGYNLGDLGGWGLDLLSLWGAYLTAKEATPSLLLAGFCQAEIGAATSTAGFNWGDVVADADAYLVAAALKSGRKFLSEAMRGLLKQTGAQRVNTFYNQRFGGSASNLATAFAKLSDGIDVGSIDLPAGLSKPILLKAAKADRLPTRDEAITCGLAYAQVMAAG